VVVDPDDPNPGVGVKTSSNIFSLNDVSWEPNKHMAAECWVSPALKHWRAGRELLAGTYDALRASHDPPAESCQCCIYATKDFAQAVAMCYTRWSCIMGEVYLWGKVVEHQLGYRAQFAYPKNFSVPRNFLPSTRPEIVEYYLKSLTEYGVDIFALSPINNTLEFPDTKPVPPRRLPISENFQHILLWTKKLGLSKEGIEQLQAEEDSE